MYLETRKESNWFKINILNPCLLLRIGILIEKTLIGYTIVNYTEITYELQEITKELNRLRVADVQSINQRIIIGRKRHELLIRYSNLLIQRVEILQQRTHLAG